MDIACTTQGQRGSGGGGKLGTKDQSQETRVLIIIVIYKNCQNGRGGGRQLLVWRPHWSNSGFKVIYNERKQRGVWRLVVDNRVVGCSTVDGEAQLPSNVSSCSDMSSSSEQMFSTFTSISVTVSRVHNQEAHNYSHSDCGHHNIHYIACRSTNKSHKTCIIS